MGVSKNSWKLILIREDVDAIQVDSIIIEGGGE